MGGWVVPGFAELGELGGIRRVTVPGKCARAADTKMCPGFTVYSRAALEEPPASGFNPKRPHAGQVAVESYKICPLKPLLIAPGLDARLTDKKTVPIGAGNKARYREWQVPCYKHRVFAATKKTKTSYTERIWYLPGPRILIVDEWKAPDLGQVLGKAKWK